MRGLFIKAMSSNSGETLVAETLSVETEALLRERGLVALRPRAPAPKQRESVGARILRERGLAVAGCGQP